MHAPLAKLNQIPASVASVRDYEALAEERVTQQAWAYMAGGAADEWTLRENCAAFERLSLRTRVLQDLTDGNTQLELFGSSLKFPILLAPVAYQKLFHPDGEMATALGATATAAAMVVSTQATVLLEDVARQAEAPLWFQLYIQPDRGFTRELARRAEAAGYQALVVTVDAPISGVRNREQRASFMLPPSMEAINLRGMQLPPSSGGGIGDDALLLGGSLLASAPTWRDLNWLQAQTSLPILVKGIMSGEDAERAVAAGIHGIIVSNHGGRTLDTQPATIDSLPEIAEAVAGRIPLLLDGGIRRGSDVFKALALGANAVLVGRPYVFGLAAAGAIGVAHVLHILRVELEITMALTGCRDLKAIATSQVRRRSGTAL
jgi:4-hydroxymandelate oxidase